LELLFLANKFVLRQTRHTQHGSNNVSSGSFPGFCGVSHRTKSTVQQRETEIESAVDCESTKESAFLNLPAELRNQIYKEAVVESDAIEVSRSSVPAEPGLLRVNRQIRKEVKDIYYRDNLFKFHLFDYDATIFIRWFGSSESRAACNWETRYHGRKNWINLHAWLKATYDGKTNGKRVKRSLDKQADIVVGIFNIVMRMKRNDIPWETVEKYLNDVRQLITVKDASWGWTL
jgi:hypothetical protein